MDLCQRGRIMIMFGKYLLLVAFMATSLSAASLESVIKSPRNDSKPWTEYPVCDKSVKYTLVKTTPDQLSKLLSEFRRSVGYTITILLECPSAKHFAQTQVGQKQAKALFEKQGIDFFKKIGAEEVKLVLLPLKGKCEELSIRRHSGLGTKDNKLVIVDNTPPIKIFRYTYDHMDAFIKEEKAGLRGMKVGKALVDLVESQEGDLVFPSR